MSEERFGLDDLTDEEKLAFGGLLRAMVSMDGTFSDDEKAMFRLLAKELGEDDFWAMLERASKEVKDAGQLLALADEVTRPQARELLFYGVNATAQAGGVAEPEGQLLDELRAKWGLERDASDSA
jgi:hypothetical protein